MDGAMREKLISAFCETTNCSNYDLAVNYLNLSQWNLEEAVNIYLSGDQDDIRPPDEVAMDQLLPHNEYMTDWARGGRIADDPLEDQQGELSKLYSAPNYNNDVSFETAKSAAYEQDLPILVNIRGEDFVGNMLNRDLWKNDYVKNCIVSHVYFWQKNKSLPEGKEFCDMYQVSRTPFIGLIDPQTGRCFKRWYPEKVPDNILFISEILEAVEQREVTKLSVKSAQGTLSSQGSVGSLEASQQSISAENATMKELHNFRMERNSKKNLKVEESHSCRFPG